MPDPTAQAYPCKHLDYETEYKLHLDEMVCRCGARRRLYGPDQKWRREGPGWRTPKAEHARRHPPEEEA